MCAGALLGMLVPCKHAHHHAIHSITLSHSLLAHTPRSAMCGAYNRARRGHAHRHQAQSSRGSWNVPSLLRGGDGRKGQHPSTSHPPRSLSVPHRDIHNTVLRIRHVATHNMFDGCLSVCVGMAVLCLRGHVLALLSHIHFTIDTHCVAGRLHTLIMDRWPSTQ